MDMNQNHTINPLTEKQRTLIRRNIGLLKKYYLQQISKGLIPPFYHDEFLEILYEVFCTSAQQFNEETGFKFSTFAYRGLMFGKDKMMSIMARDLRKKKLNPIEELWKHEHTSFYRRTLIKHEKVAKFVDRVSLEERERVAVDLYFHERLSFAKVGKIMGLSPTTVSTIIGRAVSKMRAAAGREGKDMEDFIIRE